MIYIVKAEDGIRDGHVTGVQTCALPISKKIREEFEKWTCNNPNMTLSGGIALIGGKFPILKGADEAASAEDLAKNYKRGDQTKNAFSIFGFSLSWEIGRASCRERVEIQRI